MRTFQLALILLMLSTRGICNTAFYLNAPHRLLAKNHDSPSAHGMLIQNLPSQAKVAYGFHLEEKAHWQSIYGSLTFTQLGKEFPLGGINEAGLVVEHLHLGISEYPETPAPSLTELEWIQFQLDNFGSVEEVLHHIHRLRIRPLETVHFLIADPCGHSAVIDFIEGEVRIFKNDGGPQVMSQASREISEAYYSERSLTSERLGTSPLDRYTLLRGHLGLNYSQDLNSSFDLLDITSNRHGLQTTQWNIVYDLENGCIHLKTSGNSQIRRVCLDEFDFEPNSTNLASPVQTRNLQWNPMTLSTHNNLLALGLKHGYLQIDEQAFVEHLMDPSIAIVDSVYSKKHVDLVVRFITNKPSGLVSYVFKEGQQASPSILGLKSGQFLVERKETVRIMYNMPRVALAIACFQDTEFKGTVETRNDSNSQGYSFLRTQGYHSGNFPRYVDTTVDLRRQSDITVRIK